MAQAGLESMEVVSLLIELEEIFSIRISEEDFDEFDLSRIDNLVDYILHQSTSQAVHQDSRRS